MGNLRPARRILIFDEIPSAMGHTGKMLACEYIDVKPDMLVIGKGLGGGAFSMAALIVRDELDCVGDRALGATIRTKKVLWNALQH